MWIDYAKLHLGLIERVCMIPHNPDQDKAAPEDA